MNIDDIKQREHSMNRGCDMGVCLLKKSVQTLGLTGAVVVDRRNMVLCGGKVLEVAKEIGVSKINVIETNGDTLVVIRRTDVDADSKKGLEIQLVDNLCSEQNLVWDASEILYCANKNMSFAPTDWNAEHCLVEEVDIEKYLKEGVHLVAKKSKNKTDVSDETQLSFFDGL